MHASSKYMPTIMKPILQLVNHSLSDNSSIFNEARKDYETKDNTHIRTTKYKEANR